MTTKGVQKNKVDSSPIMAGPDSWLQVQLCVKYVQLACREFRKTTVKEEGRT